MVKVDYDSHFRKVFFKIRDTQLKEKIKKQMDKIVNNPEIGKPMMYERKGTRELYVAPYRLAYAYLKEQGLVKFLNLYHKDEQ